MFPDISEHQGIVDWNALGAAFAAGQIEAVSMRAGFGTVRVDNQFPRNQFECRARGIPAIFYWFNYPTFNTPQAEAVAFNGTVGPLRPGEAMMADLEDDPASNSVFPRGQAGVDWARAFLTALQSPQNATWWYTYPSLFNAVGFGPLLGAWPFVLADYRATPDAGLTAAAIALQFTNCGSTPGVAGCCDQNRVLKAPLSQWLTGGADLTPEQDARLTAVYNYTKGLYEGVAPDGSTTKLLAGVAALETAVAALGPSQPPASIQPVLEAIAALKADLDALTLKKA